MNKININKKIGTVVALSLFLLLSIGVFVFTTLLNSDTSSTPVVIRKTKAAAITYQKSLFIIFSQNISPTPTAIAENIPTATPTEEPDQNSTSEAELDEVLANDEEAFDESEVTPTATETNTPTPSIIVTAVKSLPESGQIQNTAIIFIAASVTLFLAFLF